jgi:hypothetical protein
MFLETGSNTALFAPVREGDSNLLPREDGEVDSGPEYTVEKSKKYKRMKIVRLPESSNWSDPAVCVQDSFCSRAMNMRENLATDRSGASVLDADGKFNLAATRANLIACCSNSYYDLAWKPNQYVELAVHPFKFDKKSAACIEEAKSLIAASKVTTNTEKAAGAANGEIPVVAPVVPVTAPQAPVDRTAKPGL